MPALIRQLQDGSGVKDMHLQLLQRDILGKAVLDKGSWSGDSLVWQVGCPFREGYRL